MPAFYKIDRARRLVLSTASGVLTRADAVGHQDRLLKDPDFNPDFSQLTDFTHVTQVDLNEEDIHFLAERSIFSPNSRRALVVKDDFQFVLARVFEQARARQGESGVRVFRDLDKALDWILGRRPAA
jgi:hypothetical protein